MSELMEAKHLAVLSKLNGYFTEGGGIQTHLLEKSAEIPVNMLIAMMGADDEGQERAINLAFLPVGEDDLQHLSIIQFFSLIQGLKCEPGDSGIKELIVALNLRTTIGGFTITDDNEVALRYIHAMPKFDVTPKEQFIELVFVFNHTIELFSGLLKSYLSGEKNLEESLSALRGN